MTPQPKTATFIRQLGQAERWSGEAKLYRLSESIPYKRIHGIDYRIHDDGPRTDLVVVSSSVNKPAKPNTAIFATDETGYCYMENMLHLAKIHRAGAYTDVLAELGFTIDETN